MASEWGDGLELYARRADLLDQLDEDLKDIARTGCQLAENEADYRSALRVEILEQRRAGTPATYMSDLARGSPDIADMKRARDCSEALYKAAIEAVNVHKLQLRVLEDQIKREYGGTTA